MIKLIIILIVSIKTAFGFPYRDTVEDRRLKDIVDRTIYDTTFFIDYSFKKKKSKIDKPYDVYYSTEFKGVRLIYKPESDQLYYEGKKEPICKFKYNEHSWNIEAVEICIPKTGGFIFGGRTLSLKEMYIRAFYRVIDIINDVPKSTYKPKGYKFSFKLETPVGTRVSERTLSIRKMGYDLIRKRSKLILKKHPELLDFVKDFNKCLVKQSGLDPCAKRFFFNHQYYAPVVGENFIVPPNYIRITPMYTDVLRITGKAVKKINDHLVFDHLSRIYLTDSPETFRVYLIKRKGKWQIKAIDGLSRDPFNPNWLSNLKEHGELQWEE